ncbi:MAG: hypothetical protein DRQ49_10165 [Gammaproteobacteria bacterium]|nr:MAG: hypothetical protein DRQ41_14570 [Gammaproteobacteria bacterium]RKZ39862.1 MAG: hypothetical protein DRQ49_10165 [Gammaproteobacteria bacterium]RKZ73874.1 MAG: hypothetical protein DRQ57_12980 [Gammaproteobacteria bacterium]
MKTISLKNNLLLVFAFFIPIFNAALAEKGWSEWRDSFYKYSSTQKMTAPDGFVVKSAPYLQAKTLKEINTFTVIDVAGYLETNKGRFYMSGWSWKRALKGHSPNWIWIKGTAIKGDQGNLQTKNKIFMTHLSFIDTSAGMPLESNISNAINKAVKACVQLAQQDMPHLKLNESGHQIDNSDENVNNFINLFYDFKLTKSQKIEAIIQKMMTPNRVDVILTGQYLEKTGGIIHVRPFMLSKSRHRIVTRSFVFQDKEFICSNNMLCKGAHKKIRNAVQELLGNL